MGTIWKQLYNHLKSIILRNLFDIWQNCWIQIGRGTCIICEIQTSTFRYLPIPRWEHYNDDRRASSCSKMQSEWTKYLPIVVWLRIRRLRVLLLKNFFIGRWLWYGAALCIHRWSRGHLSINLIQSGVPGRFLGLLHFSKTIGWPVYDRGL